MWSFSGEIVLEYDHTDCGVGCICYRWWRPCLWEHSYEMFSSAFIKRPVLLAEAHKHLGLFQDLGGGLVMLVGPAGHGKTTLVREIRAQVEIESTGRGAIPMIVASGERLEPALGIWSRLASVTNSSDLMAPEVLLRGATAELTMPERHAAVRELLKGIAIAGVPLVVIDDLQAADQASLIVFSQLVELLSESGVVIVAASRGSAAVSDDLSRAAHEVLEHHAVVVEVPAFTVEEVRERLELAGGSKSWCKRRAPLVHELSGGNPLIVDRLIAQNLSTSSLEKLDLESFQSANLSQSVRDVWMVPLKALTFTQYRALQVIAALGDLADRALVMGVTLANSSEAKVLFDELLAGGLIAQLPLSPCYRVAHPGIAEALSEMAADGVALSEREHLRIARLLVQRRDPVDPRLIARHLRSAGSLVDPSELEQVARRAVSHAVHWGDPAAEAEAWTLVLEAQAAHGRDAHLSWDDLLAAAQAFRASGHEARGRELAREAAARQEHLDPVAFAEAALVVAEEVEFHGDALDMMTMLRRAHDAIFNLPDQVLLQIKVLTTLSQLEMMAPLNALRPPFRLEPAQELVVPTARWNWVTQLEDARLRTDQAEELARRLGDPEVEARVGLVWRLAHFSPKFAGQRWERTERARRVLTSRADRGLAVCAVMSDLWERGDRAGVDGAMTELAGLVAETGDPRLRWRYLSARSGLDRVSGDLNAAEAGSVQAGIQGAVAGVHSAALVRTEQRVLYEVDRLEGYETAIGWTQLIATVQHLPLLAGLLSLAGDLQRAGVAGVEVSVPDVRALVERLTSSVASEPNWMMASAFAASATAACHDPVAAKGLIELLSPYADRVVRESWGTISEGSVARLLGALFGVVGDLSAAQEMFTVGEACDRSAGFHRAVLIGTLDRVECELAAGFVDPTDATVIAQEVARDARSRGMLAIAARAERLRASI